MILEQIFNIRRSIFAKLFVTVLLMCLTVNILVSVSFRFMVKPSSETQSIISRNISRYLGYLLDSLGPNPSEEKLDALARETGLQFRLEIEDRIIDTFGFHGSEVTGKTQPFPGSPSFALERKNVKLTVQFPEPIWNRNIIPLAFLLIVITLTVALAYISIRRFLTPIQGIMRAVDAVNQGDFSHRISTRAEDETSRLAKSFNSMTKQIGEMIRAKEQLLLDVSHELRTPLTRMRLSWTFFPESKAKDHMASDIALMESMVNELLESHRIASQYGQMELIETDVSAHILEIIQSFLGRTPGIQSRIAEGVRAAVDVNRLGSLWRNLIDNALKYSADGSSAVEISLEEDGCDFIAVIADKGRGLSPDDIPYLFEPFYRVDKTRTPHAGGFGLGLALCQKIVLAHNGSIQVQSQGIGHGTTIIVRIPKLAK